MVGDAALYIAVAYTYLAGVGNVSGDVFQSHRVLHSQPVTLALNASHVHQHTSIGRQPCTQNPNQIKPSRKTLKIYRVMRRKICI